jgi:hypothetical protein
MSKYSGLSGLSQYIKPNVSLESLQSIKKGLGDISSVSRELGKGAQETVSSLGQTIASSVPKVLSSEEKRKEIINGYCSIIEEEKPNIKRVFEEDLRIFSDNFKNKDSTYTEDLKKFIIENVLYQIKNLFFNNYNAQNIIVAQLLQDREVIQPLLIRTMDQYKQQFDINKINPLNDADWIATQFRNNLKIETTTQKSSLQNGGNNPEEIGQTKQSKIAELVHYFPRDKEECIKINNRIYHIVEKAVEKILLSKNAEIEKSIQEIYSHLEKTTTTFLTDIVSLNDLTKMVILLSLIEKTSYFDALSDKMNVFHKLRTGIYDYLVQWNIDIQIDPNNQNYPNVPIMINTYILKYFQQPISTTITPTKGGKRKTQKQKRSKRRTNKRSIHK